MRPARSAPTPSSLAALASIAPDTECWNRSEINPQVNQPCLVAQRFTVAVTDAGSFSQRGSRNHRQTQTQPQSQLPRHGQSKSAWHACTARTTYPPIEPLVRREGRRLQRGQRSTAKVRTDVPASLLRAASLSRPAESSNDTQRCKQPRITGTAQTQRETSRIRKHRNSTPAAPFEGGVRSLMISSLPCTFARSTGIFFDRFLKYHERKRVQRQMYRYKYRNKHRQRRTAE